MNEFVSLLLSWRVGEDWSVLTIGCPALELDYCEGKTMLKFLSADGKSVQLKSRGELWNISIDDSQESLLLEHKLEEADMAIVFQNSQSCQRFYELMVHFEQRGRLIRYQHQGVNSVSVLAPRPGYQAQVFQSPVAQQRSGFQEGRARDRSFHQPYVQKPGAFS